MALRNRASLRMFASRSCDRCSAMLVGPHFGCVDGRDRVAGHDGAGPANLERVAVDGAADLDELAQHVRRDRVADTVESDAEEVVEAPPAAAADEPAPGGG